MSQNTILWADDEIDLLKPHIIFLRNKGYEVITVNNGADALDVVERVPVNLIILDENMPGLTGLQTLSRIKEKAPTVPVIMITKSEEENIMDQAVGSKIADYLIKPVNPNQILLSIKKNLHAQELVSTASSSGYRNDFGKITSSINESYTVDDWQETYRTLVRWELELADAAPDMQEMLELQKYEAKVAFANFVKKN
ncbi:MAG: response regulator, partial [Paramuribaculum sp.]|nr:response regulator [Paramuribaculum sp.]